MIISYLLLLLLFVRSDESWVGVQMLTSLTTFMSSISFPGINYSSIYETIRCMNNPNCSSCGFRKVTQTPQSFFLLFLF